MTSLKNRLKAFVPMTLGTYILAQGGALVMNSNPVIQLLGSGLLLWLPGCVYYTWRGFKPALPREATIQAMPQQAPAKLAA